MSLAGETYSGACHCGAVQFEVRLCHGLRSARRCSCSYCRMRGAVAVSAKLEDLTILQGAETLATYRFNTGVAEHHFCSVCGIYTHHRRRSNPVQFGINASCLKDVSPFDFAELPVLDGVSHPKDLPKGAGPRLVGTLRFVPAP